MLELEPARNGGADLARLAVGIDHQPRKIGRQEHDVVHARRAALRERVFPYAQALLQHGLELYVIRRIGSGHGEDVFPVLHRIIRRTRFGVAAVAARGFVARHLPVVGGFDLRKLDRFLA